MKTEKGKAVRRATKLKRRMGGDISTLVVQEAYERNIKFHGTLTCYLCLKPIEFGQDNLEHKTPLCRGGNHHIDNLDIAHAKCNFKKAKRTENEFRSAQANKDK